MEQLIRLATAIRASLEDAHRSPAWTGYSVSLQWDPASRRVIVEVTCGAQHALHVYDDAALASHRDHELRALAEIPLRRMDRRTGQ